MEREILNCLKEIYKIDSGCDLEDIILEFYSNWESFNIMQMLECFENNFHLTVTLEELRSFQTMMDVYEWAIRNVIMEA